MCQDTSKTAATKDATCHTVQPHFEQFSSVEIPDVIKFDKLLALYSAAVPINDWRAF
jgi:hypothetical protein